MGLKSQSVAKANGNFIILSFIDYIFNKSFLPIIFLTVMLVGLPGVAVAVTAGELPQGANVVAGSASFDYGTANNLTVTQQTGRAVIDWVSFNIGSNATTEFKQQSAGSLVVNRVVGVSTDPTQILGTLKSNGQVMVLDKNGVFFGANSRIDVGGIIASTGSIDVNQVMSGTDKIDITNVTSGSVINSGQITASEGGLVALVAPHVANSGVIVANMGRVELASGGAVTVDLYGDKLVELAVSGELANSLVENSGIVEANGGRVAMTATAAQGVVDNIINMSGIVRANSVSNEGGRIILKGNSNGKVSVTGTVEASAKNSGTGGYVEVSGNHIDVYGANIDASGVSGGGEVYIGGGVYGYLNGVVSPSDITEVDAASYINADALDNGNGGTVVVWGSGQTSFYGNITARGGASAGDGGFVEVSTGSGVIFEGNVDTTAGHGSVGELLIDPVSVSIGSSVPSGDGSYINYSYIANNLVFTAVTIQAANNIDIVDAVDLSSSIYGTPGNNLSFVAPVFNLNADLNMSATSNLILTADTINMQGRITSGGTFMNSTRIVNSASQINVLANTASIQQAVDISSSAAPAIVNVSSGNYSENIVVNKSLTLRGVVAALGAGINAPVLSGASAGGDIITVTADNVNIEGFYFDAKVAGGALADSVNAVAASAVSGLAVSYNTFDGFASSGLSVPANTALTGNDYIALPVVDPAPVVDPVPEDYDGDHEENDHEGYHDNGKHKGQYKHEGRHDNGNHYGQYKDKTNKSENSHGNGIKDSYEVEVVEVAVAKEDRKDNKKHDESRGLIAEAANYLPAASSFKVLKSVAQHIEQYIHLPQANVNNPLMVKGHSDESGAGDEGSHTKRIHKH